MKKIGVSNCLTGCINLLTLLLSIVLISGGIWLSRNVDKQECGSRDLVQAQWLVIGIGIAGILVSIAGFVGSCCKIKWLLFVYLIALFLLILLLLVVTILLFVEAKRNDDAPDRLRNQVDTPERWSKISRCFSKSGVCTNLANSWTPDFLDSIESGCCRPPKECNFSFNNGATSATGNSANLDCKRWSNNEKQLCFDCDSCKAAYVRDNSKALSREGYKGVAIGTLIVLIIVVVIFFIGYRAMKNVRRHEGEHHHRHNKIENA